MHPRFAALHTLLHAAAPAPVRAAFHAPRHRHPRARALPAAGALAACALLAGCAAPAASIFDGPTAALPSALPGALERVHNGSIFQPDMTMAALYNGRRKPRFVGDNLKVEIAEASSGSQTVKTATSRKNSLAAKGPGTASGSKGLLNSIINLDATASGSDAYDGSGSTSSATSFTGQLAVTVINVLPNGHLVIAGERSVALSNGVNTLRFSGVVDPKDITQGNVVASGDVVNARLEVAGRGDVSEAGSRNWLQRVLTHSLSVW